MMGIPRYTAKYVKTNLLHAAQAAVKDFELCTRIEALIDEVEANTIKIDWELTDNGSKAIYKGVEMWISQEINCGYPHYYYSCKYIRGTEVRTFEEAEEILIREVDEYEK